MRLLTALIAGLIFGLGLIVSRMTDPAKVQGFLDLTGTWDPSLAFVMAGAIGVGVFAFRVAARLERPLLGGSMHLPTARHIDRRLVLGSVTFGIGWGLAGICPGPALTLLASGQDKADTFVIAMLAGMVIFEIVERLRQVARRHPA